MVGAQSLRLSRNLRGGFRVYGLGFRAVVRVYTTPRTQVPTQYDLTHQNSSECRVYGLHGAETLHPGFWCFSGSKISATKGKLTKAESEEARRLPAARQLVLRIANLEPYTLNPNSIGALLIRTYHKEPPKIV